jgi:hypothetical protein
MVRSRFSVLAGILIGTLGFVTAHAQFSDVQPSRTDAAAIAHVFSRGIVSGYPDGTFHPDARINRAEFAKIAVLMFWNGEQRFADMCDSVQFDDVPRGPWFFHYICSAKDQGIVEGYGGGRIFGPGNDIRVEEAAKMITKAFKIQTQPGELWYAQYIRALADRHALPVNLPKLGTPITRGQIAEIVSRLDTNDISKPSLTYAQMTGEADHATDPCTASPDDSGIGDLRNPVADKYIKLTKLGQLFTAADCGPERLRALYGDLSGHISDLQIVLKTAPSSALYNTLYGLGFAPTDGNDTAKSKVWLLTTTVTYEKLLKLLPYAQEMNYDDCTRCG